MSYINTLIYSEAEAGATEIYIPRYTPLNPLEATEVDDYGVDDFASGVVDTSHAINVGQRVFSASNGGIDDSTKVLGTEIDGQYTIVKISKPLVSGMGLYSWLTFDNFQNNVQGKKISFSKYPTPTVTDQQPLYDIVSGQKLVDDVGLELITDTEVSISQVANKENATSVAMPSVITPGAPAVPVAERFASTTETSTSLLGIPRAETQLSLFSDVSTLGLDENDWEFYSFSGRTSLGSWESRNSDLYGSHYGANVVERVDQQAIELAAFPVPYSYPFGPRYANLGLYNRDLYNEYINFIRLGNILYNHFSTSENATNYGQEFKDRFLDPSKVTIDANDDTVFLGGISESEGFNLIDTWTRTWVDINDGILEDPSSLTNEFDPIQINQITGGIPLFSATRPGYSSTQSSFAYLQSKETYRYQPGRISGFTFGVKASSDSGSNSNIMEWGISNSTDQYVFQLRGATLSIVRRSTIPLDREVLEDQNIDPLLGQPLKSSGDPYDSQRYYTVEISRDLWNVDPLNGNGPSGYLLVPDDVTMYKIEFSWYGAIGAKFYVYIPVGNGEARWVHVHTLVIENKLRQPCLEDPNFRFKYVLNINDTARVRSPQFVYKYGASCYIDGGDEGTVAPRSYLSNTRSISSGTDTSLLGVYPKLVILNEQGIPKTNEKKIVPETVNVTSTEAARVRIGTCKACPGFGHNYNLGLKSSESGRLANFRFIDETLSSIQINPDIVDITDPQSQLFQLQDNDAKIIVDGIYSTYLSIDESSQVVENDTIIGYRNANLRRIVQNSYSKTDISNTSIATNPTSGFNADGNVRLSGGSLRNLFDYVTSSDGEVYPDQMRISRHTDAIAASESPIYGSQIDVQFLNPRPRDGRPLADFLIGVTDKKPVNDNGTLKFEYPGGILASDVSEEDVLYGEYLPRTTTRDRLGIETGEGSSRGFEIDRRLPQPPVEDATDKTGICSVARIFIQNPLTRRGTFSDTNPETGENDGNLYIVLSPGSFFPEGTIEGGEIGIDGEATGVEFTSEEIVYEVEPGVFSGYASVTSFPNGYVSGDTEDIQFTPIRITANTVDSTKIFEFDPYPLYVFVKMRDNSEIHSISVREVIGTNSTTLTPRWFTSGSMATDTSGGRAVPDLAPANYVSDNRLDSAQVDTQCEQRLRPLVYKDSFYIGKNQNLSVDMSTIYGFDREIILPDLLNTEATFFVAEPIDVATGEVQLTLNTVEQ